MFYRIVILTFVVLAAGALGGCQAWDRAIGKEKVVPDEFAVVSRAPLAVPPDFDLRPPRLGAARPQEEAPSDQARAAVFRVGDDARGNLPPAADRRSPGEGELLKEAGAGDTPKDIRQLVETDASTQVDESFVQKLSFWRQDQKLGPTDQVIDPVAESERLKSGAAAPADASASLTGTPTIERTDSSSSSNSGFFGWLGHIF